MESKEKAKTKKEIDAELFMAKTFMVKEDKKSITWMYANYGTPDMVIEVAKVEALTVRCSQPTMIVERIVDLKLRFKNGVEISGVPAGLKLALECSGILTEIVRHPTYNP